MDWADGDLGGTYSIACYRGAIASLREDQLTYGSAAVDLQRMLDRSVAALPPAQRHRLRPTTRIVPSPEQGNAVALGPGWTSSDAWRIVLASVLTALLIVWVAARVRT